MKNLLKLVLSVLAMQVICSVATAQILSIETREEKLDIFKQLLGKEVIPVEAEMLGYAVHPFNPDQTSLEVEVKEEEIVSLSDTELLQELTQFINPTGIFLFGGEFYLIFKERKMNVGTRFNVVYRGKEYTVTISEINSSDYTVRYGEAELQLKLK